MTRPTTLTGVGACIAVFAMCVCAAPRGPVRVGNGTVLTDKGTHMRGGLIKFDPHNNWQYKCDRCWKYWSGTLRLNAMRLYAFKDTKWPELVISNEKAIEIFDPAVDMAEKYGMYIILEYQSVYNRMPSRDDLRDFWRKVAPRYKDKPWVLYELQNEITMRYDGSGSSATKLQEELVRLVRSSGANNHILTYSWSHGGETGSVDRFLSDPPKGLDYRDGNLSVCLHFYGGWKGVPELMKRYPVFVTETGGEVYEMEAAEQMGVSWIPWRTAPTEDGWNDSRWLKPSWPADWSLSSDQTTLAPRRSMAPAVPSCANHAHKTVWSDRSGSVLVRRLVGKSSSSSFGVNGRVAPGRVNHAQEGRAR